MAEWRSRLRSRELTCNHFDLARRRPLCRPGIPEMARNSPMAARGPVQLHRSQHHPFAVKMLWQPPQQNKLWTWEQAHCVCGGVPMERSCVVVEPCPCRFSPLVCRDRPIFRLPTAETAWSHKTHFPLPTALLLCGLVANECPAEQPSPGQAPQPFLPLLFTSSRSPCV